MTPVSGASAVDRAAHSTTVATLFDARAKTHPERVAIEEAASGGRTITYGELARRSRGLAAALQRCGVGHGDRVAVLTENRAEYLEIFLAAARRGAIVACQNWRLSEKELSHCIRLVEPKVIFVSERHREKISIEEVPSQTVVVFGEAYEAMSNAPPPPTDADVSISIDPESALLILYTSGTTGLPKGAVISHRAQIVRNLVTRAEFSVAVDDTFVAWSPLYHMGAVDNSLGTLMAGGRVIVVDGFDRAVLASIIAERELGWLLLMPGMVGAFAEELRARNVKAKGVKVCGVMADLVPPAEIAAITTLLDAPYANTFGATETGCPPCSSNLIPIGVAPTKLSKQLSPFCEIRLVDPDDRDVVDGSPGELAMRGPTLFSGYWRADDVNTHDFRDGWFHMGDVFVRNAADGTLDFVDRVKYLIKTGGENVYPAEIERVIMQDARIADAAVVRSKDAKWGEVPIAFVARKEGVAVEANELFARCRQDLAGYKQPKGISFIAFDAFPRSASGKVQRHELEKLLTTATIERPS